MEVYKHTRYESTYHENYVTTFQIGIKIVILEYKSEKEYSHLMEITFKIYWQCWMWKLLSASENSPG